ncbi:MAG: hypothetical protein LBF77_05940 [Spirochaetaceae bacterium]|nr:hypothetical protein [Spirochaetaceae bacterium]
MTIIIDILESLERELIARELNWTRGIFPGPPPTSAFPNGSWACAPLKPARKSR